MVDWFIDYFGEDPGEPLPEPLRFIAGEEKTVQILDETARIVNTKKGRRPCLIVLWNGKRYTLWLSRRDIARPIARYEKQNGTLKDVYVRIRAPNEPAGERFYTVEVLGTAFKEP
jgi:hypothetical protein